MTCLRHGHRHRRRGRRRAGGAARPARHGAATARASPSSRPDPDFSYRPLAVAEPFGLGHAHRVPLDALRGGRRRRAGASTPWSASTTRPREVRLRDGGSRPFDALIVAPGGRAVAGVEGATTWWPGGDAERVRRAAARHRRGLREADRDRDPAGRGLAAAGLRARPDDRRRGAGDGTDRREDHRRHARARAADAVRRAGRPSASPRSCAWAGVDVVTGAVARGDGGGLTLEPGGERLDVQRVFAVPRIVGPALEGLACDEEGFILTGDDGRVQRRASGRGRPATASPRRSSSAASRRTRRGWPPPASHARGRDDVPDPGEPVLHGRLLVGQRTRRLRGRGDAEGAPLWWPHGKVAGEYLPRWLAENGVAPPASVPPPDDEGVTVAALACARSARPSTSTCSSSAASTGRDDPAIAVARPADARDEVAMTLTSPLSADALARIDAYWRAANYLVGRPDLPARQPAAARAAAARARQAAAARPLGHDARAELPLRAHEPRDPRARPATPCSSPGPGHGGPGARRQHLARGHATARSTRRSPATRRACGGCSASSRSPAASRATSRRRRPARSTRAASSATRSRTRTARRSTTRTCVVLCVVGDGEAETGPLAASWHGNKFLDPRARRRGAARPAPERLQDRQPDRARRGSRTTSSPRCSRATGTGRSSSRATSRRTMHQRMAAALDEALDEIAAIQRRARADGDRERPRWPMIVLRTPKGWTGPEEVDGQVEGTALAPGPARRARASDPEHAGRSSRRGCARTGPRSCSTTTARPRDDVLAPAPEGERRMGAIPHANGGAAAAGPAAARLPRLRRRGAAAGRARRSEATARARHVPARRRRPQPGDLPDLRARTRRRPTGSAPSSRSPTGWQAEITDGDDHLAPDGRVMEVPQRAPVPGLARGLPADRPPRALQLLRGVHPHRRLDVQPARQVAEGHARDPVAAPDRVAQLPADLARLAPGPQRLLAPGPGLHRPRGQQEGRVVRVYLPPDANCLLSVADHCLRSRDYVNVIVAGKQPALDYLSMDDAIVHCTRGLGIWDWASSDGERRAGRRAGLRRRRADARDAGRRGAAARAPARAQGAGGQRRRPDAPAARERAPARAARTPSSTRCSRPTGR